MSDTRRTQNTASVLLPENKKKAVQAGCISLMLSVAMSGLVLSTLSAPILESVGGLEYISLFSVLGALGVSIMTPIGGKLGDLIGRRNVVVIPGILCAICGIGIAFTRSLALLMLLRLLLSLAQGTFTAAPYIIVGLIHEKEEVPKAMGMLAAAIAIGGFGGSILAGILTDMGFLTLAMLLPAVPLLLGVYLIGKNLPNKKRESKVLIDVSGTIALAISLIGIIFSLSFGSTMGWTNPWILGGFVVGVLSLFWLVRVEKVAEEPLIPLHLFQNERYTTLLMVSFLTYFYQVAMNTYVPVMAIRVLGTSTGLAGSLLMPRTIVCMLLPAVAGVWVGKRREHTWKALALAAIFTAVPMIILGFASASTSILIFYIVLAVTGVGEVLRSVSLTPAAQRVLATEEIGIGTSLINFTNSLSGTVGAALYGVAYGIYTAGTMETIISIQKGCNAVFLVAAAAAILGALLVIFIVRPQIVKEVQKSDEK